MKAALSVYDWVLTLPREIQMVWLGRAKSVSAALYLSNRYFTLALLIILSCHNHVSEQVQVRLSIVHIYEDETDASRLNTVGVGQKSLAVIYCTTKPFVFLSCTSFSLFEAVMGSILIIPPACEHI